MQSIAIISSCMSPSSALGGFGGYEGDAQSFSNGFKETQIILALYASILCDDLHFVGFCLLREIPHPTAQSDHQNRRNLKVTVCPSFPHIARETPSLRKSRGMRIGDSTFIRGHYSTETFKRGSTSPTATTLKTASKNPPKKTNQKDKAT